MIPLTEFEEALNTRAAEIEILVQAAHESPDAATLARLHACLDSGAEIQERLYVLRNQLSGDLHHVNQMAQALNQDVPDDVPGDPGQPRVQALEFHG